MDNNVNMSILEALYLEKLSEGAVEFHEVLKDLKSLRASLSKSKRLMKLIKEEDEDKAKSFIEGINEMIELVNNKIVNIEKFIEEDMESFKKNLDNSEDNEEIQVKLLLGIID